MDRKIIMSGFKEDCGRLISRFEHSNDIRFKSFCEIWKDMKFSLIFAGRQSVVELLEFCEGALNLCKQFLLVPPRFKERIGGLYLLYGIYYKMPIDHFKVIINLDNWRTIVNFHTELRAGEHFDANYILSKLIIDNAFHFSISEKQYGLERQFRTNERLCFNPYSVLPVVKDLAFGHETMVQINTLSKTYEEKKRTMMSKTKLHASLILFNPNIDEDIVNDIRAFEETRRIQRIRYVANSRQLLNPSTSKENDSKPHRRKMNHWRFRYGTDFDTDTYESDEEVDTDLSDYNPNLPDNLN